jgi:hypothetical protein
MGLSAEVISAWVRECVSVRELVKLSDAIQARSDALVARDTAKAAKVAKKK